MKQKLYEFYFSDNSRYLEGGEVAVANQTVFNECYRFKCSDEDKIAEAYKILVEVNEELNKSSNVIWMNSNKAKISDMNKGIFKLSVLGDLVTSNQVGVLTYRNNGIKARIKIGSRFDKGSISQKFFLYIISKVYSIKILPDMGTSIGENDGWDIILMIAFKLELVKVIKLGLIKKYQINEYNDMKVRGRIDINRHIKYNYPFIGNIAYSIDEYEYDNNVLLLIKYTEEYIKKNNPTLYQVLIYEDKRIMNFIHEITNVIGDYKRYNCNEVLKNNEKKIIHPYFHQYNELRKTCMIILKEQGSNIYEGENGEVYGIIFNISEMWESFVACEILSKCKKAFKSKVKQKLIYKKYQKDDAKVDIKRKIEVDHLADSIVLDSKYKKHWSEIVEIREGEEWGAKVREDVFQILGYMLAICVKQGGVVFPYRLENRNELLNRRDENSIACKQPAKEGEIGDFFIGELLADYHFYTIPIMIPEYTDEQPFNEFEQTMKSNIDFIVEEINKIT